MFSHGYSTGANPWVVGPYATGNKTVGIRDYAINDEPAQLLRLRLRHPPATRCTPTARSGTAPMWQVRQALVEQVQREVPVRRQGAAAEAARRHAPTAPLPATACPGNRRWIQLVFDAFLLQQGATSMLDARDAMLAADRMRFGGADQDVMWDAFAQRGMGTGAQQRRTPTGDPTPSFASPTETNATVTFSAVAPDVGQAAVPAKIYVGDYEARAMPVADTDRARRSRQSAKFVRERTTSSSRLPGYGLSRFTQTFTATATAVTFKLQTNWASSASGASATAVAAPPSWRA